MPVMDEFKEEREALKNGTPKEKLMYFWDYYKWHVIIGIILILFIISMVHQIASKKEVAFYTCLLNSTPVNYWADETENTKPFADYAGIDTEVYDVQFDSSIQIGMNTGDDLNASQKLMVYIASAEIDTMVSDSESIQKYAYLENFYDLRDFLTQEQYEKYKDNFYYIDKAVIDEMNREENLHDLEYIPSYKDPFHPEDMVEPIPVGIVLSEGSPLRQGYYFKNNNIVVSVLVNTTKPELASQFIDYVMQ